MEKPIVALIYDFDKTLSPEGHAGIFVPAGHSRGARRILGALPRLSRAGAPDGRRAHIHVPDEKDGRRATLDLSREKLNELGRERGVLPRRGDAGSTASIEIGRSKRRSGGALHHFLRAYGHHSRLGNRRPLQGGVRRLVLLRRGAGSAVWPSMAVNYTNKTQYLFRINKGILDVTNDRDLNAYTPEYMRRVPFTNMIYIGDGLTDVPCMKMTKQKGGYSIVVHAPGADRNRGRYAASGARGLLLRSRLPRKQRNRAGGHASDAPNSGNQRPVLLSRASNSESPCPPRRTDPAEHPPPRRSDRRSAGIKAFHPPKRFLCGGYLLAHRLSITAQFAFSCRLAHRAIHSTAFSRKCSFHDKSNRRRTISAAVKGI